MADENGKSTGKKASKESGRLVHLRVRRQDGRDMTETRRWEEFKVPYLPQMNVNSALEQIRKNPVTVDGKTVAPPVWEAACLEEVCGSCTMVINDKVRQGCTALVQNFESLRLTGEDCLLFDVHCTHAERLEEVVDSLARHGPVTTSLVLRSYPPKPLPTAH